MKIIKEMTDLELLEEYKKWELLNNYTFYKETISKRLVISRTYENLKKEMKRREKLADTTNIELKK